MSNRKVNLIVGEYYHIYNRGNSKQLIFLDDYDRDRFIKLLYLCNSTNNIDFRNDIVRKNINAFEFSKGDSLVNIGAWVLMPNHFHLYLSVNSAEVLLPQNFKDKEISIFMQKLLTAYSKYFNKKYGRTGSLFECKFKSVHIDNDTQAKYLFSYIHLNPLKILNTNWKENKKDLYKYFDFLNNYKWSSYFDYLGILRDENKIIDRINFLDYFGTNKEFKKEIFEWIYFEK